MRINYAVIACALMLIARPALAQPVAKPSASDDALLMAGIASFDLSDHRASADGKTSPAARTFSPVAMQVMAREAIKVGDVNPGYITGPALTYQNAKTGPLLELGVLGGGMENMPYMAHVALDWHF